MKKTLITFLTPILLFPITTNAQLGGLMNKAKDKAEQKSKEKAEKEKKEAEAEAKQKAKNTGGTNNSGSTNSNPGTQSTNTSTFNTNSASNKPSSSVDLGGPLKMKKANSQFPETNLYKNNVGKILMYEISADFEDNKIEGSIRKELPVNKALGFYLGLEASSADFPIFRGGDPSAPGRYANDRGGYISLEFTVKGTDKKFIRAGGFGLTSVECVERLASFNGNWNHEEVGEHKDLKDSVPLFNTEWIKFINDLPMGKNEISITAWVKGNEDYRSEKSVGSGEIVLYKTKENANIDFKEVSMNTLIKRKMRILESNMIKHEGITSETHKNNIGKIVFSKSPIPKGTENGSSLTDQFNGTDKIYGRLYMDNTIMNVITKYGGYNSSSFDIGQEGFYSWVIIDEKDTLDKDKEPDGYDLKILNTGKGNEKNTTHEVIINPIRPQLTEIESPAMLPYYINKMTPGVHTIRIVVFGAQTKKVFATGEFKYTKTAGLIVPYGYDYHLLGCKNGKVDPALEGQMKNAFKEGYSHEFKNGFTIAKIIICDKEWTTARNSFSGIITGRGIDADVLLKDSYGNYKLYSKVGFGQDYNGKSYGLVYTGSFNSAYYVYLGK
jgi:hypothetical protein